MLDGQRAHADVRGISDGGCACESSERYHVRFPLVSFSPVQSSSQSGGAGLDCLHLSVMQVMVVL